eukprot:6608851-Pyramimonas_sp.AAC.1
MRKKNSRKQDKGSNSYRMLGEWQPHELSAVAFADEELEWALLQPLLSVERSVLAWTGQARNFTPSTS